MRLTCAILTDAVLIAYAYAGLVLGRVYWGAPPEMLDSIKIALIPFVAVHIACLAAFLAYDFGKTRNESDLTFSVAFGVLTGTVLCLIGATAVIVYYAPDAQPIGRSVFLAAFLIELVLLPGWRVWYTRQRRKRGELRGRVIIVGTSKRVVDLAQEIQEYSRSGHEVVGCISEEQDDAVQGLLSHVDALPEMIDTHNADEVLILGDVLSKDPKRLLEISELSEKHGLRVHILPGLYEAMVCKLDLYEIGGIPLMELRGKPLSGPYAFVKRAMDIACSLAGLIVLSPVLLVAAIAIKLDSKGPVFYLQTRSGLRGRPFEIIKLRSMKADAEKETGPVWAAKKDPRVTRVGEILRNKRIDEIPQLWNVLKGDMGLVGPRPERPHFVKEFTQDLPLFPLRMQVRPGITALSHVWGRYDSTPADRLRYDLVYISNLCFMLDIRILIDTVKIVLTGRGAQ